MKMKNAAFAAGAGAGVGVGVGAGAGSIDAIPTCMCHCLYFASPVIEAANAVAIRA